MKKFITTTKIKKKGLAVIMLAVLSAGILQGCGSNAASASAKGKIDQDGAVKVKFASGTNNWPFCYVDEEGNPAGFEFDLIKEVDNLLENYEFDITSTEWEDLVTSVKLGKLDIASWTIKKTPEREKEFLFADEWVTTQKFYLTVGANNEEIHSTDDLQGATVDGSHPDEYIYVLWDKYIKEHPEQNINLIASGNPLNDAGIEALQNGSTDAVFMDDVTVAGQNEKRGKVLKILGEPVSEEHGFYIYSEGNEELKEAVDEAIIELKENGTYDELYDKWFSFITDELIK